MYGSLDVDCDCSDKPLFDAVAAKLPDNAIWFTSELKRTTQTAEALIRSGAKSSGLNVDGRMNEMNFGDLNGQPILDLMQNRTDPYVGFFPATPYETTPNGESFDDLSARVSNFMDDMHTQHTGKDIVCVAHRGTILAALRHALDLPAKTRFTFKIDNVSLSRFFRYPNSPMDGPQYKLAEVGWIP